MAAHGMGQTSWLDRKERGSIQYLKRKQKYMVSPNQSMSKDIKTPDVGEPLLHDLSDGVEANLPSAGYGYKDLNVEVSGTSDGEPVLLLHGWGSNAANMSVIAEGLASTHCIYNIDLPGHGLSPPPPAPLGVPQHAQLIYDLILHRVGRPVTIIGHSNGGRISLYLASNSGTKHYVQRLILISPSGITPRRTMTYSVKRYTATILKAPFGILPNRLREFGLDWLRHSLIWKLLGSSDYRALEGVMRETFVRTVTHHLDGHVNKIVAPTLLFWGSKDTAISLRQMKVLEEEIPDAGLVVLEDAGHYGYLDDYSTFIAATRHFLNSA
jgi:pimeloyl-ACP methyl ester carboxylesterase